MEQKRVPYLFLRSCMGTRRSTIGQNAITSLIGYYEVERETGSKFHPLPPQNNPIVQFNTTPIKSYGVPQSDQ